MDIRRYHIDIPIDRLIEDDGWDGYSPDKGEAAEIVEERGYRPHIALGEVGLHGREQGCHEHTIASSHDDLQDGVHGR